MMRHVTNMRSTLERIPHTCTTGTKMNRIILHVVIIPLPQSIHPAYPCTCTTYVSWQWQSYMEIYLCNLPPSLLLCFYLSTHVIVYNCWSSMRCIIVSHNIVASTPSSRFQYYHTKHDSSLQLKIHALEERYLVANNVFVFVTDTLTLLSFAVLHTEKLAF